MILVLLVFKILFGIKQMSKSGYLVTYCCFFIVFIVFVVFSRFFVIKSQVPGTVGINQRVVPEERHESGEWALKITLSEVGNPS